jgi:hypothetical protein
MDTHLPADASADARAQSASDPLRVPALDELLAHIDAFLARHPKLTPTRFGIDATGEGGLVKSLREGRQPSLEKARRIVAFMAEYDAQEAAAAAHRPFSSACSGPVEQPSPGRLLSSLAEAARTVS